MDRDDVRIEELHNLRLALATFALHLDAFEMKVSEATLGLKRANHFVAASGFIAESPLAAERDFTVESPARPRVIVDRLQKENRIVRR